MVKSFPDDELERFWANRADIEIRPASRFKRVSQAVRESGGAEVQHFKGTKKIGEMVTKLDLDQHRKL